MKTVIYFIPRDVTIHSTHDVIHDTDFTIFNKMRFKTN